MHMKVVGGIAPLLPDASFKLAYPYVHAMLLKCHASYLIMLVCHCVHVLLRSNRCIFVDCFQVFAVLCTTGVTVGDDASVRSTSPSAPIFLSGKGEHISCLLLSSHLPSSRIERLLDPTTYIYASHMKPQTTIVPPHPNKPCVAMLLCSLLSPTLPLLLLGLSYHLIIIVVDDMIIIMLTIFDEGWKV